MQPTKRNTLSRRDFTNVALALTGSLSAAFYPARQALAAAAGSDTAPGMPTRKSVITERERANLRTLALWKQSWNSPRGSIDRLLDAVYAKNAAVFFPLQGHWLTGPAGDLDSFRLVESAIARSTRTRRIVFKSVFPAHSAIALEGAIETLWQDSTRSTYNFASILQFDANHRIAIEHTYNHLGRMFPPDQRMAVCSPL